MTKVTVLKESTKLQQERAKQQQSAGGGKKLQWTQIIQPEGIPISTPVTNADLARIGAGVACVPAAIGAGVSLARGGGWMAGGVLAASLVGGLVLVGPMAREAIKGNLKMERV